MRVGELASMQVRLGITSSDSRAIGQRSITAGPILIVSRNNGNVRVPADAANWAIVTRGQTVGRPFGANTSGSRQVRSPCEHMATDKSTSINWRGKVCNFVLSSQHEMICWNLCYNVARRWRKHTKQWCCPRWVNNYKESAGRQRCKHKCGNIAKLMKAEVRQRCKNFYISNSKEREMRQRCK